ncbi:MAG: hypothetical protein ACK46O_12085, partial [Flavobacteriia bacterium]
MDSRLIFESAYTYLRKIQWVKPALNSESEWVYIGTSNNLNEIEKIIHDYFITDELYVACNRNESFSTNKEQIADRIQPLIGVEDFSIWNWSFQKV